MKAMEERKGLRWTGHPVIDMGVAAVTVSAGVDRPEEVTIAHWIELMNKLEELYTKGVLAKHSSILLTINAFDNPSLKKYPEKRSAIIKDTFALAKGEGRTFENYCAFFTDHLAVDRVSRDKVPLIHGQGSMNFYPQGVPGISISALALGSILAIPLATPIISGRLMIVAMDDTDSLLDLCDQWYKDLKSEFAKISLNEGALKDRKAPRSRLIDSLEAIFHSPDSKNFSRDVYTGVTLYHLSNVGNGPNVTIYYILPHVYRFIARANAARYRKVWQALTNAFWLSDKGKATGQVPSEEIRLLSKNLVFESLSSLPAQSSTFIRRFFLRYVMHRTGLTAKVKEVEDIDLWTLVELFLNEIMTMKKERISKIRELADELADEIYENNDKKLYRQLMGTTGGYDSYKVFRQILLRTLQERLRRKGELLLTLDDYLLLFEVGEEYPEANWHLVRDLVRIRCLESLHGKSYFTEQAADLLEEEMPEISDLADN